MPLSRPTLAQLVERTKGDIRSVLGLVTILRRTFSFAIATAIAGVSHGLHGHLVFVSKQIFPDQADDEFMERWATIYDVIRKSATFAVLNIEATGTDTTVIPTGTIYQRTDGLTYIVDADIVISGTTGSGTVTCQTAGDTGNLFSGDTITLQSPIAGIVAAADVTSLKTEGEDEETIDELRIRVLERIQAPPAGGTVEDYISYAKSVAGVTRVWVLPSQFGSGTVGLTFVEDNEVPIIPIQVKVDEVQAAVKTLAPITAEITAFIPTVETMDMTIAISPDTPAVRLAIEAEIEALILRDGQAKNAVKNAGTGTQYTGTITLSKINEAISIAFGEEDHNIIVPTADVTPDFDGGLVQLGTITWQAL